MSDTGVRQVSVPGVRDVSDPGSVAGGILILGFALALGGPAWALDLPALKSQVAALLDNGDQAGALKAVEAAQKEEGISAADYAELVLLEADSREDGPKAYALLLGLADDSTLTPEIRGKAEAALGFRLYLARRCPEALDHLAKAQSQLPPDTPTQIQAAYFEGCCASESGDQERARKAFALSLKGDPSLSIWSAVGLAELDLKAGKAAEARAAFHKIFESEEGRPYRGLLLTREAAAARAQGKEAEARALWNKVLADYPDSVAALEAKEKLRELPSSPASAFTLRVGAFSTEERAAGQAAFLKKSGFTARVVRKEDGSKAPFKVWVGSFTDRAGAEKEMKKVEQETGIHGQVVETGS